MVQEQVRGNGNESSGVGESVSGVEAKRAKIRFNRATTDESARAFGDTSKPRRQRAIPREKRSEVTISDTRPEVSQKVKGKPPKEPTEESEQPKRRITRRSRPTIEDSTNTAKFLISAIEVASVTAVGPNGEMSEWERGFIQAPLQRIIQRTPLAIVEKGGLYIDIGFLTIGFGVYFSRILRGYKLPSFLNNNRKEREVSQEDTEAPVAARPNEIVNTVKAGDMDGLAVPVPPLISYYINGASI